MGKNYNPFNLFLDRYNYKIWFQNEESYDTTKSSEECIDLPSMTLLEGDEVKDRKELKVLTPNKILSRLPILLTQIKAGKSSYKLKNEMRQILYLLYQYNKITKNVYNNLIKSL